MFPAEAKRGVEGPEEEDGGRKVLKEDGFEGAVSKRSPYLQSKKVLLLWELLQRGRGLTLSSRSAWPRTGAAQGSPETQKKKLLHF